MQAPATYHGATYRTRRQPVADLFDWVRDVALLMTVFSIAAVAVAYAVLLMIA